MNQLAITIEHHNIFVSFVVVGRCSGFLQSILQLLVFENATERDFETSRGMGERNLYRGTKIQNFHAEQFCPAILPGNGCTETAGDSKAQPSLGIPSAAPRHSRQHQPVSLLTSPTSLQLCPFLLVRNDPIDLNMSEQISNADAIADAKISPGDDYEEIREQVRRAKRRGIKLHFIRFRMLCRHITSSHIICNSCAIWTNKLYCKHFCCLSKL